MDDLSSVLNTLLVVSVVAALAPLIVALLPGLRIPQIVVLIIGGILIGPQGFGLAEPAVLNLMANIGLGLVFLLAGYELDPTVFAERAGRLALLGWVITAAVAAGLVGALAAVGFVHAFVPVALGLTTTALGTLLPILRDHNLLAGRFGRYILAAGAVGELLPILAIAIFLGAQSQFVATPVARFGRGARPHPLLRAAARARHPDRANHGGRRARHVPDHAPVLHRAAPVPVRGRGPVRSRRGAGRVPGGDGAAPVGTRRHRTRWRRSSTLSATASSSRSSSWCRG